MEHMDPQQFCEQYRLNLNPQQLRALSSVEGPVLMLAVPGSGKTTVLVARLGYMILGRGIPSEKILAITFTRAAAADMRRRYISLFGEYTGGVPEFRTINGLCAKILERYALLYHRRAPRLLENEAEKLQVVRAAAQKYCSDYLSEEELQTYSTMIGRAKNLQWTEAELKKQNKTLEHASEVYAEYIRLTREYNRMDYDDQMVYALQLLKKLPPLLEEYRAMFPYICVDEAQDTSRLQHEIIALLAAKSRSLFMVGDEDQSIYGFRGAWPQALLEFRERYPGAVVLPLESNYRSRAEIVAGADRFIAQNETRFAKQMKAVRGSGAVLKREELARRTEQYEYLVREAAKRPTDTAVLYRDNDSALPLIDLLLRRGVPFRILQVRTSFFTCRVVRDIRDFFALAEDPFDIAVFLRIYYKFHIRGVSLKKELAQRVASRVSPAARVTVFDALARELDGERDLKQNVFAFRTKFAELADLPVNAAINRISAMGYRDYLEYSHMDAGKLDILKGLADAEPDRKAFFLHLEELAARLENRALLPQEGGIVLSTVHSAKGLEFDTVYLMDLYDGMFPKTVGEDGAAEGSVRASEIDAEEERRLFYVAVTRAKNSLTLLTVRNYNSSFADELLPVRGGGNAGLPKAEHVSVSRAGNAGRQNHAGIGEMEYKRIREALSGGKPVFDRTGRRWRKCGICGQAKPAAEFPEEPEKNIGKCRACIERIKK